MAELERNLLGARTEAHTKVEIYSGVARLARTVWGSEVKIAGTHPTTALMICHPTANFLGHYALNGLAERGFGAVGFTTRYVGNDSTLIMESCLLDMGTMVEYLYASGYERVVLIGNSGGASIVPYYQSQALDPTVSTPAGGGPDLTTAGLRPVDAIIALNAHPSRSRLSTEWLDPSIHDELHPFDRDPALDMFHPDNTPPYSAEFIARYRAAQIARNRRIAAWCEQQLDWLANSGEAPPGLEDVAFTIHGTGADLRFLDGNIDPSDRTIGARHAARGELPAGDDQPVQLGPVVPQPVVDRSHDGRFAALASRDHVAVPGRARHRRPDGAARHGAPDVRRGDGLTQARPALRHGWHTLLREPARAPRRSPRHHRRLADLNVHTELLEAVTTRTGIVTAFSSLWGRSCFSQRERRLGSVDTRISSMPPRCTTFVTAANVSVQPTSPSTVAPRRRSQMRPASSRSAATTR
jgi:hypothetical protein